jgi:hypothetical protein
MPAVQQRESVSIPFVPRIGQTSMLGETRSRTNSISTIIGQAQFRATANTVVGQGEGRVTVLGGLANLRHFISDKGRAVQSPVLTVLQRPLIRVGIAE